MNVALFDEAFIESNFHWWKRYTKLNERIRRLAPSRFRGDSWSGNCRAFGPGAAADRVGPRCCGLDKHKGTVG
ncbi:hypothetical protein [Pelomonas cellulosilytica]|uniref:Uncharacterized protein n=1 Tax=Pelomonas cellulosilytica TaxID=2906762 RepID=A0ABS8XWE9_9BURK|nr:hypothetical protein [Pelomonas sp. P8]MCE4556982.1 hypothetical protein [Pelomonas sp. P8]